MSSGLDGVLRPGRPPTAGRNNYSTASSSYFLADCGSDIIVILKNLSKVRHISRSEQLNTVGLMSVNIYNITVVTSDLYVKSDNK